MEIMHHPTGQVGLNNPLAAAVFEKLYSFEPIRSSASLIDVRVWDGKVELAGNVHSRMIKRVATDLVLSVPGVMQVYNELVTDSDIDISAAAALAWDERTRLTSREVAARANQGIVHLAGSVSSNDVKVLVEQVVRGVKGVRDVVNNLKVTS
jgi:osmotically-inducible protein OsmY